MAVHLQELEFSIAQSRDEIAADWMRLEADPLNALHQSMVWCDAWEKTQGTRLMYLRGMADGSCYLLLPLERRALAGIAILQPAASAYSNINTGLVHAELAPPTTADDIVRAQNAIAACLSPFADLLLIANLALEWRGRQSPFNGMAKVENQNQAFQLPLLGTFEETLAQINAKRRRKKLRISQREAEALGGYQHRIAQSADEKRKILKIFFEQKALRFAKQGLPDVFAKDSIKAFFVELALAQNTNGADSALELHYLELSGHHQGKVIAVTGISRKGDHCICQFGSIDEDLAGNISPGELLFYHVIEREQSLGSKLFDFGIGDQRYKRSWCPVSTVQYDIHVPASWKGKLLSAALQASTHAKTYIKGNAALYGLLQKLRRQKQISQED